MLFREIKISSYLFTLFSNNDANYRDISKKEFDLEKEDDIVEMLRFLRKWGCRQFKMEDQKISAKSLRSWYTKYYLNLPPTNNLLVDASEEEIKVYVDSFNKLMNLRACRKEKREKQIITNIGLVGASKILFGLRKNFFPPWDNPIINENKFERNGDGYIKYLIFIKSELLNLKMDCKNNSIDFYNLPSILEREYVSLVKLADEYFWLTITKKCAIQKIINLAEQDKI